MSFANFNLEKRDLGKKMLLAKYKRIIKLCEFTLIVISIVQFLTIAIISGVREQQCNILEKSPQTTS